MEITTLLRPVSGFFSLIIFYLFGTDPTNLHWLYALCLFMVIDLIMGIHDAKAEKQFSRQKLFEGIYKKVCEFFMIVVGHWVDELQIIGNDPFLQKAVTGYLIGYELYSILCHIKFSGAPVPKIFIESITNIYKTKAGK